MQSLLGQPSAVSQLLGLLAEQPPAGQPGAQTPMPAAPMPNVNMTPVPPQQINAGMMAPQQPQSLLGEIHDYVVNHLGGNVPPEYQQSGLLSNADLQAAKPGLMQIIAHSDSYRKNLDRIVQMKQLASGLAEQQRIQRVRSEMPQNLDLPGMLKYAAQHGDVEMIKSLGGPLEGMLSVKPAGSDRTPEKFTLNGKSVQGFSDKEGKLYTADGNVVPPGAKVTPYVPPKEPGAQYVWATNPAGQTVYVTKETAAQPGYTQPKTDNAQQELTAARATAGIAEMNNANAGLKEYEDKLINGTADIKGLDQFIGSVGDSFLLEDMKSKALQSAALAKLNRENPELARYIRRGMSFAEGETGISQRPSDYRTKLAAFLSTAASGASPEMIADIRSRRESILGAVNSSKLAPKSAGKPKLTQAGYENGRAKHLTDAQLEQHYDLTGVTRK